MPATAFGPLVEPGWPDLKGPDIAEKFLAGAALGANINAKQKALENQLALYSLRAQGAENLNEIREKQYELARDKMMLGNQVAWANVDLAQQRVQGMLTNQEQLRALASDKVQIANDRLQEEINNNRKKWDRWNSQQKAQSQMMGIEAQVLGEGLTPGTEEYKRRVTQLSSNFAGQLSPSVYNGVQRTLFMNNNAAWQQKRTAVLDQEKAFRDDIKDNVWGDGITTDLRPILHPEQFPHPKKGNWWSGYETDPNSIEIPAKDPTGMPYQRPVAIKTLQDMKKRYEELQKTKSQIGTGINRPDLGVYTDHVETPDEKANRILQDPEATDEERNAATQWLNRGNNP